MENENPIPEEPVFIPEAEPVPVPSIDPSLRIIYFAPEGGVAIIIPAPDCGLTIEQIAAKDVPAGLAFKIVDVSTLPDDLTALKDFKPDILS